MRTLSEEGTHDDDDDDDEGHACGFPLFHSCLKTDWLTRKGNSRENARRISLICFAGVE